MVGFLVGGVGNEASKSNYTAGVISGGASQQQNRTRAVATSTTRALERPVSIAIGVQVRVINTGSQNLNIRSSPWGRIIGKLPPGSIVTVIAGPERANAYTWWRIRTRGGVTGWVAEGQNPQWLQVVQ
jgi:hypothetical protein